MADLMEARRIFAELGAEQFLWHATDHLMAARPELRDSLLDENDRRLDMLSSQLGANERNFFELNKYRAREWQWRSRIDQVVKLRAGAGDGWVSGTKARLAYLIALHRLVRDLDEEKLRVDREGQPRTAYSLRHTYICLRLMEGADIYQIAKNCRTSVEMFEKYYASDIKTSLDAVAINVMRPKKRKSKDAA